MKGLILCAGQGKRLQPFTYARPKCMIPVNGEPIIVSIINKMMNIGVHEIGIVLNTSQESVRELLGSGEAYGATLTYLLQEKALGIAHAVKIARSFIQDESFFLMLGDNLIEGDLQPLIDLMIDGKSAAALLLTRVENPYDFGVVEVSNNKIVRLEEKPKVPRSDLVIVGAYVFSSGIWSILDQLVPSKRGEYELSDALQILIDQGKHVDYSITTEPFFDIGSPERWLSANRYKMSKDKMERNSEHLFGNTDVVINPPVQIDPSAQITQSVVGPYVYIGPDCVVENCRIENSILTDHVQISHVFAQDSIFGSNTKFTGSVNKTKPSKFIMGDMSIVKD